jgi:hypothetical protein
MKISKIISVAFLIVLLTVSHSVLANSTNHSLNKPSVQIADDFYKNNVNKKDYQEFTDAKLKVRKLIMVQDLPKVFGEKEWMNYPSLWRELLKKSIIVNTKDLSPDQQVYYFFSLKNDGEKIYIQHAMYDATTKKLRSKGFGHWTKEEFKKFEQK